MDIARRIIEEAQRFLVLHHDSAHAAVILRLDPAENIFSNQSALLPCNKGTFILSVTNANCPEEDEHMRYFVKLAGKREIAAQTLVNDHVRDMVPAIRHTVSLDGNGEVFLTFSEYVPGSDDLWFLLSSLRLPQCSDAPSTADHRVFAGEMLKTLAARIAVLHYCLSEARINEHVGFGDLDHLTESELGAGFDRGVEYLGKPHVEKALARSGLKRDLARRLETHVEEMKSTILQYPHWCLLHGDLQLPNVIWSPERPERIVLVDWEHASFGPAVLDVTHLGVEFRFEQFLKYYLDFSNQLMLSSMSKDYILTAVAAGSVYRNLRLAGGSEAVFRLINGSRGVLSDEVEGLILGRIHDQMELFAHYRYK